MPAKFSVSVVVPVFNSETSILKTLESLSAQSLKNIEIIVIDDASTDNSFVLIEQFAKAHSNVVAYQLEQNSGAHEARLYGIHKARAGWIGFLDADDLALPKMYEKLYQTAVEQGADIVSCGSDRIGLNGKRAANKVRFFEDRLIDENIFSRFCQFEFGSGTLWNRLYKKSVLQHCLDMHFPWRQDVNEDLVMNLGAFYRAKRIYLLSDVLHHYRATESSVTAQYDNSSFFIQMFKAFAFAVDYFKSSSSQVLDQIVDLYASRFESRVYRIKTQDYLNQNRDELKPAVTMIYLVDPAILAIVSARKSKTRFSQKLKNSLTKRLLFLKFLKNRFSTKL